MHSARTRCLAGVAVWAGTLSCCLRRCVAPQSPTSCRQNLHSGQHHHNIQGKVAHCPTPDCASRPSDRPLLFRVRTPARFSREECLRGISCTDPVLRDDQRAAAVRLCDHFWVERALGRRYRPRLSIESHPHKQGDDSALARLLGLSRHALIPSPIGL